MLGASGLMLVLTQGHRRGWIRQDFARKAIHILMGMFYMVFWPLFPDSPCSAAACATVPLLSTLAIGAVGAGALHQPALVAAASVDILGVGATMLKQHLHECQLRISVLVHTPRPLQRFSPYTYAQTSACTLLQRQGRRQELLQGPVLYGLAIVACTVYFWRTTPAGIMGIAVLCVGDGMAEVIGRRYGRDQLPHNKDKVRFS